MQEGIWGQEDSKARIFEGSASGAPLSAAPLEPDAIHSGDWTPLRAQEFADEASALVELYGYRSDSVSSIQRWVFSPSFGPSCNGFRYISQPEDQGGTWVVTLD